MKPNTNLGNATRTAGKMFFALTLLFVAIAAGFGGTALLVYHHLDGGRVQAARTSAERKAVSSPQNKLSTVKRDGDGLRPVAAVSSDRPSYTFADNNGGQPSTPVKHVRSAANVPAPLENEAVPADTQSSAVALNDPESHYIVDSRTGRVVGIDGTAGARREEEQERKCLEAAPRAVAVQTPPPEVRVASAVVEEGQPIYRDGQSLPATGSASQYLPVRRALPVAADENNTATNNFNVAEYMAGGQSRPVLRAQPVGQDGARGSRAVRVYRLPDGSQIVAAD